MLDEELAVVGVPGEAVAAPVKFPIRFIQHPVGQHGRERRERAALRHAESRCLNLPLDDHAGLQEAIDLAQQAGIRAATLQPRHQPVRIHPAKEGW